LQETPTQKAPQNGLGKLGKLGKVGNVGKVGKGK